MSETNFEELLKECKGHTPGPWKYFAGSRGIYTSKEKAVGMAYGPQAKGISDEARAVIDANGRLMSKAPTLLAHVAGLQRENERLRAGRVPCKTCDGTDDAAAENAQCYNCRNMGANAILDLERELSQAREREKALVEALKRTKQFVENYPPDFQSDSELRAGSELKNEIERLIR